jgi:hypothetical protein
MKSTMRMTLATGAALITAAISVGVAWSAPHSTSTGTDARLVTLIASTLPGPATLSHGAGVAVRSIACPAVEFSKLSGCVNGYVLVGGDARPQGVTATGQASLKGTGTQVRDQAIQQAVADAKDQAEAAARAAGVTLDAVIDIQISAPGFSYPYALGEDVSGQAVPPDKPTTLPGADPSSGPCPGTTADCLAPEPGKVIPPGAVPVETFVSVTVTWSIAG